LDKILEVSHLIVYNLFIDFLKKQNKGKQTQRSLRSKEEKKKKKKKRKKKKGKKRNYAFVSKSIFANLCLHSNKGRLKKERSD